MIYSTRRPVLGCLSNGYVSSSARVESIPLIDNVLQSSYALPDRPTIWPDYSLNLKPDAFTMPVDYVAIVAAPAGELFHFTLSMVSKTTNESIRINMKPQAESMLGLATVEYNDYDYLRHYGPDPFIVRVSAATTVGTILKIIFDEDHMDHYT